MILEDLTKAIIGVIDENGNEISYNEVEIKLAVSKYSQTKKPTPTLFIDNIPNRNSLIKVRYKCACGRINEIFFSKYKVKKELKCTHCNETQEKRKWHGEVIRKIHNGETYVSKNKRCNRKYNFDEEPESYKNWYYSKFLTEEEFYSIKKYIYSINNVVVEGKEIKFLPHENGLNAIKYRQMVIVDGKTIPLQKIMLRCDFCGNVFSITRRLKERCKNHNFDCKECYLVNKSFKPQKIDGIIYQGKQELNFINRCKCLGVKIINGPHIKYYFKNKWHTYKVDFELPELNLLIEIKDNHIWHKRQVESGKWEAKEIAAIEYSQNINYTYHLLFPNDFDNFFNNTIRDSLTNSESC